MSTGFGSSLRAKITAGLATALLVLLVGGASYFAVGRSTRAASLVSHTDSVLIERERLLSALKDAETGARGYLITGDTTFLEPYNGAQAKVSASLRQLRLLTADNRIQQARLDTLESVGQQSVDLSSQIIRYRRNRETDIAQALLGTGQSKSVMDHAQSILSQMEADESKILAQRTRALHESTVLAGAIIVVGSAIAFLLSLVVNRGIRRDVIAQEEQKGLIERQAKQLEQQAAELARQLSESRALAQQLSATNDNLQAAGVATGEARARAEEALGHASEAGDQLRLYATQLRSLAEAAIEINATLAADAMLQVATENARRILHARRAQTRLTEETLSSGAMRGLSLQQAAAIWHAAEIEEPKVTSWTDVTMELRGVTLERLADADAVETLVAGHGGDNAIAAPLVGRNGRTLGIIQLWEKKEGKFNESDEAVLTQLAQMCSVALENARLYKAAQDATRARDDFVAIVSHDLRNPVHTINMAAGLLLEIAPPEDRRLTSRRQLEVIQRAAHRANRLISDLLDVAKIQAGGLTVEPTPVDVPSLVQEALESATPMARPKQLTIERVVAENVPLVAADRDRVLQVFGNLLGNAIKFTPNGGKITIRAEHDGNEAKFAVCDTGPGIPPDHVPHVFDRYWQAKSTAKLGTGLGLSIAKGIVEAHSGRIWVESEPGRGASFIFTLPYAEPQRAPGAL
jgi:signal transduction histidine kinase/CHASE3 domain sensor protein